MRIPARPGEISLKPGRHCCYDESAWQANCEDHQKTARMKPTAHIGREPWDNPDLERIQ
jgi:hypothetical protein